MVWFWITTTLVQAAILLALCMRWAWRRQQKRDYSVELVSPLAGFFEELANELIQSGEGPIDDKLITRVQNLSSLTKASRILLTAIANALTEARKTAEERKKNSAQKKGNSEQTNLAWTAAHVAIELRKLARHYPRGQLTTVSQLERWLCSQELRPIDPAWVRQVAEYQRERARHRAGNLRQPRVLEMTEQFVVEDDTPPPI
jgi:hypothetical protein